MNQCPICEEPLSRQDRCACGWNLSRANKKEQELFFSSLEWRRIRYEALKRYGQQCACCGRTRKHGIVLHVDHIKPRSKYPHLALDIENIQILCEDCNLGKGNIDQINWREKIE